MFSLDSLYYPYPSRRNCVYAKKGMVATSHPLASQAGLEILKKGGNAIDAAIATAACLTVVEPTSNGLGGDCFALVWCNDKLHGLNASGYAPKSISIPALKERGFTEIPRYGLIPVTIPGQIAGWVALSNRFGKLSLKEVLEPAITYAKEGFPVSPTVGYYWQRAFNIYKERLTSDEFSHWFKTFAPKNKAPEPGDIVTFKDHAKTLELIALTNGEVFYQGEIAEKIAHFSKTHNGFITKEDLANYQAEWVEPICVSYKGYNVWEIPPNGQGLVALMALNILKNDSFTVKEGIDTIHHQIEAMKLAFADAEKYLTDINYMPYTVEELLSESYAKERRKLIQNEALLPSCGTPPKGGTVYLATSDKDGNMVSFIQSNYMGFGSGIVIPDTGIALHNRGHNFSFDETSPNALGPLKKPYHTIIPGFLTKGNTPIGPFGVMGGFMQPQGHLQVIMNTIDFNLNPQAALDAPRWQWVKGKQILVEPHFPTHLIHALAKRGHQIQIEHDLGTFGRGQIIWRNLDTGVYIGGTELRCDGTISSW